MQQWYQCPNCGAPVAFGVRFCGNCRTQLNWPAQQQREWNYGHGQQGTEQKKTSPWLTGFLGLIGVVLLVIGGSFAFNIFPDKIPSTPYPTNTSSPSSTIPPSNPSNLIPTSVPSHSFPRADVVKHSEYWNASWGALELYQKLISFNSSYHKENTYIEGVFDCNDMAVDIWNILYKQGIVSVIVAGNLDIDKERFAECNHAWLLILHRDKDSLYRIFIIEPTNGETYAFDPETKTLVQYMQGYFYSSPSDLRADIRERW